MGETAAVIRHLVLPGYGSSGPTHWQSRWESDPSFRRVELGDWESPRKDAWVARLESAVAASGSGGLILVAHSMACLLVAHWSAAASPATLGKVKAAFLVAPADPAGPEFPAMAQGFAPFPLRPLPFKSLLVASSDDPYAAPGFARACAQAWNSDLREIGPKGHINSASNLGDWAEGRKLLAMLS